MRTLRTLSLAAAVSVALALTGCTSSTEGTANSVGVASETNTANTADTADKTDKKDTAAPVFDLCSVLSNKDLEGKYLRTDMPLRAVRKSIEYFPAHDAGMAACHYGTFALVGGMKLSVPLGDPEDDVSHLVGGGSSYGQKLLKPFTIGSDKGYLLDEDGSGIKVAVQHGDTQFMLYWRALKDVENDQVSHDQMIELATMVAAKLPTKFSLKAQDLPKECDAVKGMDKIVGKVTMAWGTADADRMNCTYVGPKGFLRTRAMKWRADLIEDEIKVQLKVTPEDEVKPAIASDVVAFVLAFNESSGLYIEGNIRLCCTFDVEYEPMNRGDERSVDIDADERLFLTSLADASRVWK